MEELDIGMKCIKYMLFVANFMFIMVGFLLISIGTTIKAIYGGFEIFMETHYFSASTLAVVVGVILFFVALFGCFGALKESTCIINLFGLLLALILILEVGVAIAAYSMRANISKQIERRMNDSLKDYEKHFYEREAWDFVQENLHCCGIHGYLDWDGVISYAPRNISIPEIETSNITLPDSCCHRGVAQAEFAECNGIWGQGCLDSLVYIVSECALLLGCGAVAVAFIQLLGIIFAHMLAKAVRKIKTQDLVERQRKRETFYEQMKEKSVENPTPVIYTNYSPDYTEA